MSPPRYANALNSPFCGYICVCQDMVVSQDLSINRPDLAGREQAVVLPSGPNVFSSRYTDERPLLQRRRAVRKSSKRIPPRGPRPCPPSKKRTVLHLATPCDIHRLSINSNHSVSSHDSAESAIADAMPVTPPLRPSELPPIRTIFSSQPKQTVPLASQNSIHVVTDKLSESPPISALSMYSQDSPVEAEYDADQARKTRMKIAADLRPRRRASRKGTAGSLSSATSMKSADWLWDRHFRYGQWEENERIASAKVRKAVLREEQDNAFEEWRKERG